MSMPTLPGGNAPSGKSFWSKPEGKTALAINVALAVTIFYFWGLISAFVVSALLGGIQAAILAVVLASILYVAFDSNFRRMVWYLYRSVMRWVTQWFVNIDPIGILKTYKEKMSEKKAELDESIGDIRGQRQGLATSLADNQRSFNDSTAKLTIARKRATDATATPEMRRQAERIIGVESPTLVDLQGLIQQQKQQMDRYDNVVTILVRYSEVCEDHVVKFGRQIKIREEARNQSRAFRKGMAAAMGILRGLPEQEESDMAIDSLEKDYARVMGEVENAINLTRGAVLQSDFANSVDVEKAAEILDAPAQIAAPQSVLDTKTQAKEPVTDYTEFFK